MAKKMHNLQANRLKISKSRSLEASIKAEVIEAVLKGTRRQRLTHEELAKRSGLAPSVVTGILSGGIQRVSLDRVLCLMEAVGLTVEIKTRKAS